MVNRKPLCQHKSIIRQFTNKAMTAMPEEVSNEHVMLTNCMVFARPVSHGAQIVFMHSNDQGSQKVPENFLSNISQPVVFATLENMMIICNGSWIIEKLTISQSATLFSFLDYQSKVDVSIRNSDFQEQYNTILVHTEKNLAVIVEEYNTSLMGMLISTMLKPQDSKLECLFTFIRNVESYWISHFLLSQVMNEDNENDRHKIGNASKVYGVSESYFRKLCHNAFMKGPKKQLRLWRAAYSALQLIEKDNTIATIAGNNGYASSSHFSSEIKSLFGISPREFKKLEDLLDE